MPDSHRFNEDGPVRSDGYADTMRQVVLPALEARREVRSVTGYAGWRLYCEKYMVNDPRGTVVIVHGFTSTVYKYSEMIFSLLHNGFCVLAYDQRGHGRSQRDADIRDLSLTHVDRFEDYVQDLQAVCDTLLKDMPLPHMVFCHSMGGAVTGLFLERFPGVFSRAVFCAPMIAPNCKGIPVAAAWAICAAAAMAGKSRQRIFMSRPYDGPEHFETSCASGKERFEWYDAAKAAEPQFQNNGPTFGWTQQSLRVTRLLLKPGEVEKITIPVRVYGAETDNSVLPDEQIRFAERLPNGFRAVVPGSRHEIYRSGDGVLFPWWHEILQFFGA